MYFVTEVGRRKHFFHALGDQEQGFIEQFQGQPFVLLVFFDKGDFVSDKVKVFAEDMLRANVRYVVCAGSAAEEVHDLFDEIITNNDWETMRKDTIMTTYHNQEPAEEVLFHYVRLTCSEQSDPTLSLMVFPKEDKQAKRFIEHLKKLAKIS